MNDRDLLIAITLALLAGQGSDWGRPDSPVQMALIIMDELKTELDKL